MPKIKYEDCEEWSNNCGKGVFKWTDSKTGQEVYSDICRYVYFSESEFEGDFKKYEFDKSELHIPRKYISAAHIIYLEIDNRIIIGVEDKHDI